MKFTRRSAIIFAGAGLLSACGPAVHRKMDADVIIIGAGLSGLHAARMLSADGANIIVLEAAERVGGRIWTLDDVPGRPEAGGQQIGQTYARTRATARDLGIPVLPYPDRSRRTVINVGDALIAPEDWAGAPQNVVPEAYKAFSPASALFVAASRENPFEDNYAWREIAPAADVSAAAFLRSKGFSDDALEMVDRSLNANTLETYAMANVWRSLTLFAEDSALGPSEYVDGGSQRLTDAMGASLGGAIRLGEAAKAIDVSDDGVTVTTASATLRASRAICTLPFPALSGIDLNAPLTAVQHEAIAALPYTQILQIHMALDRLPDDGLPLDMWTDSAIERVFTVYDPANEPVGLTCWINGTGAGRDLSDEAWIGEAEARLLRLRGIRAKGLKVVRWQAGESYAGGAYMHWAPGQIGMWAGKMGAPAGRLHFAGEHLSFLHTGIEGAMEAGERAAYEVIEAMAQGA